MKQRFSTRTRLVSALLTLAMVFTFLPFSAFAEEELTDNYGIIPLAEYVLPDKAFREYLKEFDTNGDEILAPAERYAVTEIHAGDKNISNLYGIQFFPNLKMLYCYNNQLTKLDVSKNTALVWLDCSQNQLTELDVRQNAALWGLFCEGNQLSSLDVSKNTALDRLDCHLNNLTSLNVRQNTELVHLYCNDNKLTSLDVSQNPELWILNCSINQLTELDVSQNPELEFMYCNDNNLTSLDVSRNNKIFVLDANNNYLTNLNVENTSIDIFNSSSKFVAKNNTYPITVDSDRTFDLSTLPGTFDVTKATKWNGGTVSGNTLKVNAGVNQVTYTYDCGKRSSKTFTLNVTVVPEDSIGIDALNFPDPNFRAYVKAEFDKDYNNSLSESERNAVKEIDVSKKNISNLFGIQFFPNLRLLYCYNNQLTKLDVSKNTALVWLDCSQNQLTELDVRQNAALWGLFCDSNQLSSLDVSNNTALERLDCHLNNLTSLDVSQNPALQKLQCDSNQLTSLDVSQTAVTELKASDNKIDINIEETSRTFDLSTLPGFDVSKATNWKGGTVNGSILTVDEGATKVTYSYDCGRGLTSVFSLQVLTLTRIKQVNLRVNTPKKNEMPDETVVILDNGADVCDAKIRWGMGDIGGEPIPGSFRPGKEYTLQVGLYAKPGYKFSEETVCTVNGRETKFIWTQNDDTEYYAIKSYVVPLTPGGFEHDHKMEMTHDEHSHWMECPICHTVQATEGHVYDNDEDTTCNVCGYVRSLTPGGGSTGGGDGGGAVVIVAAVGAVAAGVVGYGVYNYVSGRKLRALLPEGVAAPENRAQTALLLWNTAGRPEPAEAPAFADVADPDTAKAAQWCVEQGLMKRRLNGKFAPGSSIPAYQVLNAYRKLAGG